MGPETRVCYGKAKTHRTDTGNVSKNNFLTSSYELDQFIKKIPNTPL